MKRRSSDGNPITLYSSSSEANSRSNSPSLMIYAQRDEDPIEISSILLHSCGYKRKSIFRRFFSKIILKIFIIIAIISFLSALGSIPRYCTSDLKENCLECPNNSICTLYSFKCNEGYFKNDTECINSEITNSKITINLQFLIYSIISLISWIIVSIIFIVRQKFLSNFLN